MHIGYDYLTSTCSSTLTCLLNIWTLVRFWFENGFLLGIQRDLVARDLWLPAGNALHSQDPVKFVLGIELHGDPLPAMRATPTAAPFTIAFFLSKDAVLGPGDIPCHYSMTPSISGDLSQGIPVDTPLQLIETIHGKICGAKCLCSCPWCFSYPNAFLLFYLLLLPYDYCCYC